MKFVRIASGTGAVFAVEADDGYLYRLDAGGGPSGYLALQAQAATAGQTVSDYTRAQLDSAPALPWTLAELDVAPGGGQPCLLLPLVPPEVWGAAFTYPARPGVPDPYADMRGAGRPVIFFKATPHRCVGPNDAVGSRADATAMIPEPELGALLDAGGRIIGYTVVNDVSSRDLPALHPLYVCYSKTFDRCVSLGPAVIPPEAAPDPGALSVTCRVTRGERVLWDETGSIGRMTRTLDDLVSYTISHNRVPPGTLLATGTAMSPPRDMHLQAGDLVECVIPEIGRLANPVVVV
jgi:2-dehydro-3-deoxy-D-arabinonate dehydratase